MNLSIEELISTSIPFEDHDRNTTLGASEAPAILGQKIHRWNSAHHVFMRKRGIHDEDISDQGGIQRGTYGEGLIMDQYSRMHPDAMVWATGKRTIINPHAPWASASPDGFARFDDGSERLVEAKWPGFRTLEEWGDHEAPFFDGPLRYNYQCQWQMWVTGADRVDVIIPWDLETWDFRVYVCWRNSAMIEELRDVCGKFWNKSIIGGEAPEWDGSDDADTYLKTKYAPREGGRDKKHRVDMKSHDDMQAYDAKLLKRRRMQLQAEDLSVEIKRIDQQIKDLIGEAYGVDFGGESAKGASYFDVTKSSTDWKKIAIAANVPEDLIDEHTKKTMYRVLRISWHRDLDAKIKSNCN